MTTMITDFIQKNPHKNTILVDFNSIVLQAIQSYSAKNNDLNPFLVKHLAINAIREIRKQFKFQYPNTTICFDNKKYWRKSFFPLYKIKRKINREKSNLDFEMIFPTLNELKIDIQNFFTYKTIDVSGAEADDSIAVLSKFIQADVLIVSSDSDFKQLHDIPNLKQFSPKIRALIKEPNPSQFLLNKIIKGDPKDGVPNILSPNDCFATNTRQKTITQKKLNELIPIVDSLEYYNRNNTLLNLNLIPENIKLDIIEQFVSEKSVTKMDTLKYLRENNFIMLLQVIDEL